MTLDRRLLDRSIDQHRDQLFELARRIHRHPELGFEERQASNWLCEAVRQYAGVSPERPLGGLDTAFRARVGSGRSNQARVAVLAEYDALPEIGHACGHNLIGVGALAAFLALAQVAVQLEGTVELIGTPAEEGGGGKLRLLDAGVFDEVDAALMFHPADRDILAHPFLASSWLKLEFHGRPAHAAAAPENGASALTACLESFRLVDSQRVHFKDGVRVHGIVTDGGQAANVIPERAAAEFSVRSFDYSELRRVRDTIERCAQGAALACGVELSVEIRDGYRELNINPTMAQRFGAAMKELGRSPVLHEPGLGTGSTDMGNISQRLPAIHPLVGICARDEAVWHTRSFAACTDSEAALEGMLVAAKALARTSLDLLEQPDLLEQARRDFLASSQ